jgi:uncharacterized protein YerC
MPKQVRAKIIRMANAGRTRAEITAQTGYSAWTITRVVQEALREQEEKG